MIRFFSRAAAALALIAAALAGSAAVAQQSYTYDARNSGAITNSVSSYATVNGGPGSASSFGRGSAEATSSAFVIGGAVAGTLTFNDRMPGTTTPESRFTVPTYGTGSGVVIGGTSTTGVTGVAGNASTGNGSGYGTANAAAVADGQSGFSYTGPGQWVRIDGGMNNVPAERGADIGIVANRNQGGAGGAQTTSGYSGQGWVFGSGGVGEGRVVVNVPGASGEFRGTMEANYVEGGVRDTKYSTADAYMNNVTFTPPGGAPAIVLNQAEGSVNAGSSATVNGAYFDPVPRR